MKIRDKTYENLTPIERVIAAAEASARDDDEELQRLHATCPRKTYEQPDAQYQELFLRLLGMTLASELDIANVALSATLFHYPEALKETAQKAVRLGGLDEESGLLSAAMPHAKCLAALDEATARRFEEIGIPRETCERFRPKRHPLVDFWASIAPDPSEDDVQEALKRLAEVDSLKEV